MTSLTSAHQVQPTENPSSLDVCIGGETMTPVPVGPSFDQPREGCSTTESQTQVTSVAGSDRIETKPTESTSPALLAEAHGSMADTESEETLSEDEKGSCLGWTSYKDADTIWPDATHAREVKQGQQDPNDQEPPVPYWYTQDGPRTKTEMAKYERDESQLDAEPGKPKRTRTVSFSIDTKTHEGEWVEQPFTKPRGKKESKWAAQKAAQYTGRQDSFFAPAVSCTIPYTRGQQVAARKRAAAAAKALADSVAEANHSSASGDLVSSTVAAKASSSRRDGESLSRGLTTDKHVAVEARGPVSHDNSVASSPKTGHKLNDVVTPATSLPNNDGMDSSLSIESLSGAIAVSVQNSKAAQASVSPEEKAEPPNSTSKAKGEISENKDTKQTSSTASTVEKRVSPPKDNAQKRFHELTKEERREYIREAYLESWESRPYKDRKAPSKDAQPSRSSTRSTPQSFSDPNDVVNGEMSEVEELRLLVDFVVKNQINRRAWQEAVEFRQELMEDETLTQSVNGDGQQTSRSWSPMDAATQTPDWQSLDAKTSDSRAIPFEHPKNSTTNAHEAATSETAVQEVNRPVKHGTAQTQSHIPDHKPLAKTTKHIEALLQAAAESERKAQAQRQAACSMLAYMSQYYPAQVPERLRKDFEVASTDATRSATIVTAS